MATVPNPFESTDTAPAATPQAQPQQVAQPAVAVGVPSKMPAPQAKGDDDPPIDMRIYGGRKPDGIEPPDVAVPPDAGSQTSDYSPPVSVPFAESVSKGSLSASVGAAQRAANAKPEASVGSSLGASISSMSPFKVYDWVNAPSFEPEAGWKPIEAMDALPFTPSEDEDKFLRSSHSPDEFVWRAQQLGEQRDLQQRMGSHPVMSMLLGMADPGYLALDALGGYAGHIAGIVGNVGRVGRTLVSAGVSGAGAVALGKIEQQTSAMSDNEVVLMGLINGAGGALSYHLGQRKMVKVAPDYPEAALTDAVNGLQRTLPEPEVKSVRAETPVVQPEDAVAMREANPLYDKSGVVPPNPGYTMDHVQGMPATGFLDNIANGSGEFAPMARALREIGGEAWDQLPVKYFPKGEANTSPAGTRAYYNSAEHSVYMPSTAPDQTIIHELSHGITAQKIEYGLANPDSAHGKLVSQLEDLRQQAIKQSADYGDMIGMNQPNGNYFNKNLKEFVAGLFSGDTPFTRMLADMPHQDGGSMLGKLVTTVRKMLGMVPNDENALTKAMGLTEDLIKNPLDVKLHSGDTVSFAPHGDTPQMAQQIISHVDKEQTSMAGNVGDKLAWSLYHSLAKHDKDTARLLVDDPVHMNGDSVVSQQRAIRDDLSAHQYKYEDQLKAALAEDGFGLKNRILQPKAAITQQKAIEKEVALEMLRRDSYSRQGVPVPEGEVSPRIKAMADSLDQANAAALQEMKRAGVSGADDIAERSGYFSRKWDITQFESLENKLVNNGMSLKQAKNEIKGMLSKAMMKSNPSWTNELADDVSGAIIRRTKAKGYFEDNAMRAHQGNEAAKEVRGILEGSGVSGDRLQKAMDVLTGVTDEKGKMASMKHRIDMDMNQSITHPDGSVTRVADLVDTSMNRITQNYLDNAAAQSAFARKGMKTASDIDNLRTNFLEKIKDPNKRADAAYLIDNTLAAIKGQPVGEKMNDGMRKMAALTQMVGLASSGLWKAQEFAVAMARFGMAKTVGNMIKEMPGFKNLLGSIKNDKGAAEQLSNILSRNSSQDMRIRPFLQKMEDNFEMPISDTVMMSLQQTKQLVPYVNAMQYLHHYHANVVGNLVADTFLKGAQGDTKAIAALGKYGLESHTLDKIKGDIAAGGLDTSKWSANTWDSVRGPLSKMMDESVLRHRTGEIPAFAQFSSVGKFIFTFRSFILASHNKLLAGSLGREGFSGLGLLMAYQYPMTYLAVAANEGMRGGKKKKTDAQLAGSALSMLDSIGLFGDLAGVITGEKQQFGTPGLIALDRAFKVGSQLHTGKIGNITSSLIQATPILSIIPGTKAIAEHLKD